MSRQLFAFKLAKPVEPTQIEIEAAPVYDPQTQTAVWVGGSAPFAMRCTWDAITFVCRRTGCTANATACWLWDAGCGWHNFMCDR